MKITKVRSTADYELVYPNFIYNRFDLFCPEVDFEAVKLSSGGEQKVVEYQINADRAELGLWLTPITEDELEQLLLYIRNHHENVNTVLFKNAVIPYGQAKKHNHFRVVFPETVEEMERRVSSKSRAKMRKKIRFAEEIYGPMRVVEYDRSTLPDEIVDTFFRFKLEIRGRKYNMTAREYLDRYHVSHCYVLMLGETVGAIRFSCEQCPVVYGENFTYNPEMKDYSLGRYVFFHHLIRMVEKKHSELFFAGGDYEYKTHYGSIEETLYDCTVKLSEVDFAAIEARQTLKYKLKQYLKEHLPENMVKILSKVNQKLKF